MFHLVYVSSAVAPFSGAALHDLLQQARAKNQRLGITGLLLYKEGNFMQLLEGEQTVVQQMNQTIGADPRHSGKIVVIEQPVPERLFADWSMGFRDLSEDAVRRTPGFSAFLNCPLEAATFRDDPSGCLELLSLFRATR